MHLWRLARAPFKALDGEGARLVGGRWSSVGLPVVYASTHLSLAALEILVHTGLEELPSDLLALEIEADAALFAPRIDPSALPQGWAEAMESAECRAIGDAWARAATHLGLPVPSAVIPSETNVLLNPRHAGIGAVAIVGETPFRFDTRLLRR